MIIRDKQGRYFSIRRLIHFILLTLFAIGLALAFYQWDLNRQPLFNPLIEDVSGKEKTISEIIADKERRTVTEIIAERFGEYADEAVRVAYCESRLNRNAISKTQDYGVFQIHKPVWFKKYHLDDESALFATENVAVAYDIFKNNGYSWKAWYSSYKCHGLR